MPLLGAMNLRHATRADLAARVVHVGTAACGALVLAYLVVLPGAGERSGA